MSHAWQKRASMRKPLIGQTEHWFLAQLKNYGILFQELHAVSKDSSNIFIHKNGFHAKVDKIEEYFLSNLVHCARKWAEMLKCKADELNY